MATFMRDVGISHDGWRASEALRMRVSMSAMGSLIVMLVALPAGLGDAGDLAGEGESAEANAAQREPSDESSRAAAQPAAAMGLDFEARRTLRLRNHRFLCQVLWPPV